MIEHKNIAAALALAQAGMGKALKDSSNPAFKSKYADLASVMEACMGSLNANGIAVIQPTTDDDAGRYVETIFIHGPSGETLKCRVPLIIGKNDMQGYGSAVTYARRYGLMSMAGIAPEDDDGNAAVKAAPMVEDRPRPLTDAFNDAVKDSLPPNATPEQTAEAYAEAIAADFKGKGKVALDNAWRRHEPMINRLKEGFPKLHDMVVDACEMRANELKDEERA
jgi:hypothetical protein